jgi:hypothetical protein
MGWGEITEVENTPPNRPPTEPEHEIVVTFKGEGIMNTPLFTVEKNWRLLWVSLEDDNPIISIYSPEEEFYSYCSGSTMGISYFYGTGTYYIHTSITGPWAIIVDYQ